MLSSPGSVWDKTRSLHYATASDRGGGNSTQGWAALQAFRAYEQSLVIVHVHKQTVRNVLFITSSLLLVCSPGYSRDNSYKKVIDIAVWVE